MNSKPRCLLNSCAGAVLLVALCAPARAQIQEGDYKGLYAAAEYDKALAVVASIDTVEAKQYQALCLLALGRQGDAVSALEALVNRAPSFVPSSEEVPPRFVDQFTRVRKRVLPSVARRLFTEGRDHYTAKKHDEAVATLSEVLTLVADPAFEDVATAQDLKTLAQGFIDLARAKAAPPPAPVAGASPPATSAAAPPTAGAELPTAGAETPTAAGTPPPTPAATPPSGPIVPRKVVQPTAITQTVPPVPSDLASRMNAKLTILVEIGENGRVTSARVQESANPMYDRLVIQATRSWRFNPATVDGKPVPSEQVVTIQTRR